MTVIDRNGKSIEVGDRVSQVGIVTLVNRGTLRVRWDHPERDVVGYVLSPGSLEVQPE